jgi:hypothetical protein
MGFPFAPILGAAGALPGAITSIAGLFDNSANRAVHERNKARVRQINFNNSLIRGENLKIRSDYNNRKLSVTENIDNIRLASDQARGLARQSLDRATEQSMMSNQKDIRRMYQQLGYRSGTMNVGNRKALLGYSQIATERASRLMNAEDDLISTGFMERMKTQNDIKLQKERVAMMPQFRQYVQTYEPEQYTDDMLPRILNAAGGLIGAGLTGLETYDKFKVPDDLDQYTPGGLNRILIRKRD